MDGVLRLIPAQPGLSGAVQQRVLLYQQELYRVPATIRRLRVVDGCAFVTQAARDLILCSGHEATLEPGKDDALVSALAGKPLVLELCRN